MSDMTVVIESKIWPDRTDLLSEIMGSPGSEAVDELGRSLTWQVLGFKIVAYDEPNFEDDACLPLSKFKTGIQLGKVNTSHYEQSVSFRKALGVLLVLYLRDKLGSDVRLLENLQSEITVP
jgi:hypothetical protein